MAILLKALTALALAAFPISAVSAQSLSGVRIGDNISVTARIGYPPTARNQSGPFTMRKWKLEDGNDLSVTTTSGGTIVYIETDWGGEQGGSYSDFPRFYYGRTSLSEIRKNLGNNGFAFGDRTAKRAPDGSIVFFNSYEIVDFDNTIITFITKIDKKEAGVFSNKSLDPASYAKLMSIILGYPEYLRNIWGSQLVFDPAYQKIRWP
jgi:hypothetical protein